MKLMIGVKSGDLPGKYIFKSEGRAKGERRESEGRASASRIWKAL